VYALVVISILAGVLEKQMKDLFTIVFGASAGTIVGFIVMLACYEVYDRKFRKKK
jgi:predicted membrane protein